LGKDFFSSGDKAMGAEYFPLDDTVT
jgi:hypothetical protein